MRLLALLLILILNAEWIGSVAASIPRFRPSGPILTGPDGQPRFALIPRLYLPAGQLDRMADIAGGVIRGRNITLDAGAGLIDNTGQIIASDRLTVNAGELANRARSAAWGSYTQGVKGGYIEVTGDRVQPGGYLSAAVLDLNAPRPVDWSITLSAWHVDAGRWEESIPLGCLLD